MTCRTLLGIVICLAGLGACGDEKENGGGEPEPCTTDQTWAKVANPILDDNCRTCHNAADAEKLGGGHDFTNEAQVRDHGHEMFEKVESGEMPPKGFEIAAADKNALLDWLECSGASKAGEGHTH